MTRRLPNCARSPISSSVIPSAKYSWAGSSERFTKGKTAREPNCFADRDAFTVAFDEPKGQCIRCGNFATIPTKTRPSSSNAPRLTLKSFQRGAWGAESEDRKRSGLSLDSSRWWSVEEQEPVPRSRVPQRTAWEFRRPLRPERQSGSLGAAPSRCSAAPRRNRKALAEAS